MKQRVLKTLLIGFVAAAVVLAMSACEGTITIVLKATPAGEVLDAKTKTAISDATVSLTYVEGLPDDQKPSSAFTTTSGSDGSYSFGEVPYATYKLSASKSGYVFIQRIIDVTNASSSLPIMLGFTYDSTKDSTTLSIVTTWSSAFQDVDAHITYPASWHGEAVLQYPNDSHVTGTTAGFLPEHNETGREHVYYDSDHQVSTNTLADLGFSGTSPAVELDVDDTDGSGPETISLRAIPIKAIDFATTYGTEPDTQNGLPGTTTQYDYAWVGTAAFYVHGYSAALTEAGQVSTAQVEVFVFQGDTMLGLFTVPDFTQVNAIQLFRINFLLQDDGTTVYDFFQLVPEQAIFTDALPQTHVGPDGTVLLRSLEDETPVLNLRGAAH